jgi:hypothetical protein
MVDDLVLKGANSLIVFIFLNADLVRTAEADLIEDKNLEHDNKFTLNGSTNTLP